MKYFLLLFSFLLLGCTKQETKPELDYVNIEIFPLLGGPPSNLKIDLSKKTMVFSNIQHMGSINENCDDYYEKIELPLEFVYVDLSEVEINTINSILNDEFLNEIKKTNESTLKNEYTGIFDGILFEFDILSNNKIFSTDDLIILNRGEETKILTILKILEKHVKTEWNKKYFKNIFFYLNDSPSSSNYKQKFP